MSVTTDQVLEALAQVDDPTTRKKLVATPKTVSVSLQGSDLNLNVALGYPIHNGVDLLRKRIETKISELGINLRTLTFEQRIIAHAVQRNLSPMPNVRNIIAVASGKGGVGKSTTAVNLALALQSAGARVGLLDADIYGPSVPLMLGIKERPKSLDGKSMEPIEAHGLQANSIGFLINDDSPAIWRGPMATQALTQLLTQTNWKDLDYLIVDMPPGTGDIALTMAQNVPLTGAIIVTTPQDMALIDARKGLRMFQKVDVPVLGIIENMSVHVCSNCGHVEHIFGQDGARSIAQEYGLPWLGALPLQLSIRTQTDSGNPTVVAEPEGAAAGLYRDIAREVAAIVANLPRDMSALIPKVVVRKT